MNPPRRLAAISIVVLVFALVLRLAGLDKSLWMDEVGSYVLATAPDFIASARNDIHPPLYYGLLRLGIQVTSSVPALRLLSVLCGLLTVGIFLRLRPPIAAVLAATLVACSPELISNSQELRQYALLNLLLAGALMATLHLLDHPDSKKARRWLLATSVLAASTHLLSGFFLLALGAALLFFQRNQAIRKRIGSVVPLVPALVLLLLFRFIFLTQVGKTSADWWTGSLLLSEAAGQFGIASGLDALHWTAAAVGRHMAGGEIILLPLAAAGIGLVGWAAWFHKDRRSLVALFIALFYWGLLAAYSWKAVNLAIARLIVPGMLPLFASIAFGISSQPQPRLKRGAMTIATLLAVVMTFPWVWYFAWRPREDLRGLTTTLHQAYQPGDVLVFLGGSYAFRVYWPTCDEETQPLKIGLADPYPDSLEELDRKIAGRASSAAVTVVYRDDGGFRQRPGIWQEIEAHLRAEGRAENSVWDRDYYHIVHFSSPAR